VSPGLYELLHKIWLHANGEGPPLHPGESEDLLILLGHAQVRRPPVTYPDGEPELRPRGAFGLMLTNASRRSTS
jgi:hypothetical protein